MDQTKDEVWIDNKDQAMNPKTSVTLKWSDPIQFSEMDNQGHRQRGVYLWGFTIDGRFIPYYVGIADNILSRIFEHLNGIIGGRYTLYHRNSLARFRDFKNLPFQDGSSQGKIYYPVWPYSISAFWKKRKEFQPHIDFMVESFTFSYALADFDLTERVSLKELEKLCILSLGLNNLGNTRGGQSNKYILSHSGNPMISGIFK